MPNRKEIERLATELSKKLADEGKLIEAGWTGYRMLVLPPDAPQIQVDECRFAFMAGSQHLFSSIMTILDSGDQESEADLRKMDLIDKELRAFGREMALRASRSK
ncbi:hypothetical protein [Bradyrhizobium zhanjiangense]|uniref:Uncharacterized protein n=1 Tax=Bradyrhizobium zhanjiangense TaxID=1325107 RepID=A0ABY0DI27_9BRAD|nr:hypothetical protein [Bradyrhizobium zhanjiangense]RXG91621.1 hypothetical protein EAS62_24385 [Bradyrhizobium zhanjiangense]